MRDEFRPITLENLSDKIKEMSDEKPKIDLKAIGFSGVGGAAIVSLLMNFQQQGIDLIAKNNASQTQIAIEKTIANATRIDRVELDLKQLNDKIDRGFESLRGQIREDTGKLSDLLRIATADRYSKSEHNGYAESVSIRLEKLEEKIQTIDKKTEKK